MCGCHSKLFSLGSLPSRSTFSASQPGPFNVATAGVVSVCIHDGTLAPLAPASTGSPHASIVGDALSFFPRPSLLFLSSLRPR